MPEDNSTFPIGTTHLNDSRSCNTKPDTDAEIITKIFALSVVLFVSTVGNLLVIGVVQKNKSMRQKSINLYIVNLAASDLLLALFLIPRIISELLTGQGVWLITGNLGEALCKIVIFVQDVSIAVSVQSLVIIAFDRFCAVVYPLRIATTSSAMRLVVIPMTWLVACAMHSPYFYTYRLAQYDNNTMCINIWSANQEEHENIMRKYYLAMFCLFFAIPVMLLAVLYSIIFYTLRLRSQRLNLRTSETQTGRRKEQEWNVLKMAFAIVLAFFMCYGPLNVVVFLRIFKWGNIGDTCNIETIMFVAMFLFLFNTALNPFIYFVFSENFRLGFVRIFVMRRSKNGAGKCFLKSIKKIRTTDYDSGHKTVFNALDTAV